jgi:hypothetical protein
LVSHTESEKHKLKVSETGVLRNIFGPKRNEVAMELRRLHNEELHDLYSSPNIIRVIKPRRMRWAWNVARVGRQDRCVQGFDGGPKEKRILRRPRRTWDDNIKINVQEVGW